MRTSRGWLFAVILAAVGFAGTSSFGKSAKADAEQVECKDGTMAKKGRGACSRHGGMAANVNTAGPEPTFQLESATVLCKDGTSAKKVSGACSDHGGVARAMTPSGSSSASQKGTGGSSDVGSKSGKATARCKDGTLSYSARREGACSDHGGVDKWLGQKK